MVEQCLEAHLGAPLEDDLDLQIFIEDQLSDTEGPHGDADFLGESDPDSEVFFAAHAGDSFPVAPPVAVQSATSTGSAQAATSTGGDHLVAPASAVAGGPGSLYPHG